MAIKRVTIQIDDQVGDLHKPTDMPQEMKHEQTLFPKKEAQTGESLNIEDKKIEQDNKLPDEGTVKKTGRTNPDLFMEIKDDPRCVIAFFTVISFGMFSLQLGHLGLNQYLKFSILTSVIFNAVWFLAPVIINFLRRLRRSKDLG